MLGKVKENKWSIFALGMIAGGLFLSRGGLAVLMPLLRFALPVILFFAVLNMVKKKLLGGAAGDILRRKMADAMRQAQEHQAGNPKGTGKVIDLCPRCGSYLAPGHRCKAT